MSLHLYSGPPKAARHVEDLDDEACERYLRQAAKAKSWIPSKLGFEEIMKNKTLPPCSLNDFMDYLMYVEHKAEYLQFFMWYCDYLERWTGLTPEEKALAPKWNPEAARKRSMDGTAPRASKQAKRSASVDERNKLGTILDMMDREADRKHAKNLSTTTAASSLPSIMETVANTEGKWVPYSSQPFREEVNKAVRHYLTAGAPRQIALSEADRTAVLHAVENTTHPSALLPAFATAEAVLRGRCHPNFVRWSVSNANRPLTWCLRVLGATVFLAGLALDVVLVLSHQSRLLRLAAVPLWALGLVVFSTSWHGLSLPLYWRNRRQLRPWDRDADGDVEAGFGGSGGGDHSLWRKKHKRSDTATSTLSHVDPLRKPSLRAFGPDNGFGDAAWAAAYRRRFWGWRVCDDEVASQNGALRGLQWRVVVVGSLMAVVTTGLLAVGFWFVPAWPVLRW